MIFKLNQKFFTALSAAFICLFCIAAPGYSDVLLSGGLIFDSGTYVNKPYRGPLGDPNARDEQIDQFKIGLFGGIDLGFKSTGFGIHMSNALLLLGGATSKTKGDLDVTELLLRTQMTYNFPTNLPFSWAKKANPILYGINPWVGVGPVMNRTISRTVVKTGEDYEPVTDLMDFGLGFTIGFKINFWEHFAKSKDFQKMMTGITYVMVDVTYIKMLTPDDENSATDNGGQISRDDWVFRIGSGLRFKTGENKDK